MEFNPPATIEAVDRSVETIDISELVNRQRVYFQSGATRSLEFRVSVLKQLSNAIELHREELLAALEFDLRKSVYEATSSEIAFVLAEIDFAIKNLRRWMKPRRVPAPRMAWPSRAAVVAEPLGVSLIIGTWNYPLQLLLVPLVGSIAAGNCGILKPSELAPKTATAIASLIGDTFDLNYISVVQGDRDVAEALLAEKFDSIFFTGSTKVGRQVAIAAAKNLTPVTLELGGKSPCVVFDDANIPLAARRIAWGKMLNAGQTCVAPDFVLVDAKQRDALVAEIRTALKNFFGDDPNASPHFGRIVNDRQFDRLVKALDSGEVAHGGQHDRADRYLAPTIILDPKLDSPLMCGEIFGPILPIVSFDSVDHAFQLLKEISIDPLAAYCFSNSRKIQQRFIDTVRAGGVCINDTVAQLFGKYLPFGGVGQSGMGRYHGKSSFDTFSNLKTVLRCSGKIDLPFRYPPVKMPVRRFEKILRIFLGK